MFACIFFEYCVLCDFEMVFLFMCEIEIEIVSLYSNLFQIIVGTLWCGVVWCGVVNCYDFSKSRLVGVLN